MTFIADRSADPADSNPVTGTVGPDGRWDLEADPRADPHARQPAGRLSGQVKARDRPIRETRSTKVAVCATNVTTVSAEAN